MIKVFIGIVHCGRFFEKSLEFWWFFMNLFKIKFVYQNLNPVKLDLLFKHYLLVKFIFYLPFGKSFEQLKNWTKFQIDFDLFFNQKDFLKIKFNLSDTLCIESFIKFLLKSLYKIHSPFISQTTQKLFEFPKRKISEFSDMFGWFLLWFKGNNFLCCKIKLLLKSSFFIEKFVRGLNLMNDLGL